MAVENGTRWLAVGTSRLPDSRQAGAQAATAALRGAAPALLLVFCDVAHDLPAVLEGIRKVGAGTPLIGCSTAGELSAAGPTDDSVVVTALGGPGFRAVTRAVPGLSSGQRAAGARVAGCASELTGPGRTVFIMFTDGLVNKQEEILRGAYGVLGAGVPLVGGCAGDALNMRRTYLFHDGEVLNDAVVAAALRTDGTVGIGVDHGWRRLGEPLMITRSAEGKVFELSDEPALDVYLDRLDAPAPVRTDQAAFTRFALLHPLGLARRSGQEMRFIAGADFTERALTCLAEVPQGGLVWLTEGSVDSVLDAADAACVEAIGGLDGALPAGLVAFDCIARRGVLGERGTHREVDRVIGHAGTVPVSGFYTYGEIARTRGINGFHNQTMVVLALS